jgi:hypothetical protein
MSLNRKLSVNNRLFGKILTTQLDGTQKLLAGNNLGPTEGTFAESEPEEKLSAAELSEKLQNSLTKEQLNAYLAGLIDGDGSIYCLLANRIKDGYTFGYEIRPCASITQRPEKQHVLVHANTLSGGIGTLRRRSDNIASLDFHGRDKVSRLVPRVKPYLYLKRKQARLVLHVIEQMPYVRDDAQKFLNLCRIVDRISQENDGNNLQNTSETVRLYLLTKGYKVV